jgi:hypothetical protein
MVNGVFKFFLRTGNFRFQGSYPLLKLGNGEWIKVLPLQGGNGIIGLSGQIFVHVHEWNVDPARASVNKGSFRLSHRYVFEGSAGPCSTDMMSLNG